MTPPELPNPDPPLSDGTVVLRAPRDADVAGKLAWGADEEILRWTDVPAGYTEAQALAFQAERELRRRAGEAITFVIVDATTGELLGSCDLRRPDPDHSELGELGYLVAAPHRRRGVASRALRLVVVWALAELGMTRVQAHAHPENVASLALLESLGFRRGPLLHGLREGEVGPGDRVVLTITNPREMGM